jgi:hypothetical protein
VDFIGNGGQSLLQMPFGHDATTAQAVGQKVAAMLGVPYESQINKA